MPGSYAAVVAFLAWSIEVMATGVHPSQGHVGEALPPAREAKARSWLADGWTCHFVGWQGDLKEKVQCHGFARNYLANALCEWCLASRVSKTRMNAYYFGSDALWRLYPTTHAEYVATAGLGRLIFMRRDMHVSATELRTHACSGNSAASMLKCTPWLRLIVGSHA